MNTSSTGVCRYYCEMAYSYHGEFFWRCIANDNVSSIPNCLIVRHVAQEGVAIPVLCKVEKSIFQPTSNPRLHFSQVKDSKWLVTFSCVSQWSKTGMLGWWLIVLASYRNKHRSCLKGLRNQGDIVEWNWLEVWVTERTLCSHCDLVADLVYLFFLTIVFFFPSRLQ